MNPEAHAANHELILAVLTHIERHLDAELDRDLLAQVANVSPFHFSRIFKRLLGEGPMEFVRRLRLEQAAARLRFGRDKVLPIALDAGFQSHESFTRAFRSRFGMPPSRYRRIMGKRVRPEMGTHSLAQSASVRVLLQPTRRLAYAREVGPYLEVGLRAWQRLFEWATPLGLMHEASEFIGRCHDDPEVTPIHRIRYDAAIPVPAEVEPSRGIGLQDLPGGRYAQLRYVGPMEREGEGWYRLLSWLADHGHRVDTTTYFEIYRRPMLPNLPAEMVSDLYVLLDGGL